MRFHPETQALAQDAYKASGCKTYDEFSKLLGGIGRRTVARWMLGECPLGALPKMVLRNIAAGWRPKP